jgi:hypothetical protein
MIQLIQGAIKKVFISPFPGNGSKSSQQVAVGNSGDNAVTFLEFINVSPSPINWSIEAFSRLNCFISLKIGKVAVFRFFCCRHEIESI